MWVWFSLAQTALFFALSLEIWVWLSLAQNITYDMLDAPQVLRSSQELQTLLILLEQLPGSMLPWYLYICILVHIFVYFHICTFECPKWPDSCHLWGRHPPLPDKDPLTLAQGELVQDVVDRLHLPRPHVVQPGHVDVKIVRWKKGNGQLEVLRVGCQDYKKGEAKSIL